MSKFSLSLLFIACFSLVNAQPSGYKIVKDLNPFKTKFNQESQSIFSITSDFTQTKNLKMLAEKIVSKGQFSFKKNNKVRMEYLTPYKYLLVINNNTIYIKKDNKLNTYSAKSNKAFNQINKLILECVQGIVINNKDFNTSLFENETIFLLQLIPNKKEMKNLFQTIQIYIDKKNYTVNKLNLIEASGDNTELQFTNKNINPTLSDDIYILK